MHILDALELFCSCDEVTPAGETPCADECPVDVLFRGGPVPEDGAVSLYRTALASLSGQLDDAAAADEAFAAVRHGEQLFKMGVISEEKLMQAMRTAFCAVIAEAERTGISFGEVGQPQDT